MCCVRLRAELRAEGEGRTTVAANWVGECNCQSLKKVIKSYLIYLFYSNHEGEMVIGNVK